MSEQEDFVYKTIKGTRRLASGEVKEYTYTRKYPKPTSRGRKPCPNKYSLRTLIKNLDEDQCARLLEIAKKFELEDIYDENN